MMCGVCWHPRIPWYARLSHDPCQGVERAPDAVENSSSAPRKVDAVARRSAEGLVYFMWNPANYAVLWDMSATNMNVSG